MKFTISLCLLFSTLFSGFAQQKIQVYFNFNSSNLNEVALSQLQHLAFTQPDIKILKMYGFCDSKGTYSYNDTLSLQRIHAVYKFLKENKIEMDSTYTEQGFGKNFQQNSVQALNRKVEIEYFTPIQKKAIKIIETSPKANEAIKEVPLSEKIKSAQKGDKIKLKNINFFNNSAQILPKSLPVLHDLLVIMKENPNLKIEIQGHICCQRSNVLDHISKARARAIYDYLIENNIKRNRLKYEGFGVKNPIYPIPEKSPFEEEENRRVELQILDN